MCVMTTTVILKSGYLYRGNPKYTDRKPVHGNERKTFPLCIVCFYNYENVEN